MPVSKKRSQATSKKGRGITPPTTGRGYKKPVEASNGKPRRSVPRGFFSRFKTFRSASDFRCDRCNSLVREGEYMGTATKGASYLKLCESCKWKVDDASSELVGEDTRRPWVKALHSVLRIPMFALYGVTGLFALLIIFSAIQLLIFGSR